MDPGSSMAEQRTENSCVVVRFHSWIMSMHKYTIIHRPWAHTIESNSDLSAVLHDIINIGLGLLDVLTLYIGILLTVAFYTLAERKFMGSVQRRMGPNVVGFMGLLQAFADALKLILKELVIPYRANKFLFIGAPFMFLTLALLGWAVMPFAADVIIADILYGLLFIYLVSSMSVFGVIIAGWASNSKYPFLGALRSAAQMISYEVSMGFILIIVSILTGSFNLIDIVLLQKDLWLVLLLSPLFLMFLVSILAETNRAPFDLPEAEAELVAGYNLEYSGIMFAMFFLAEYANMLLMSFLTIHLFLGGWSFIPFSLITFLKAIFHMVMFGIAKFIYLLRYSWVDLHLLLVDNPSEFVPRLTFYCKTMLQELYRFMICTLRQKEYTNQYDKFGDAYEQLVLLHASHNVLRQDHMLLGNYIEIAKSKSLYNSINIYKTPFYNYKWSTFLVPNNDLLIEKSFIAVGVKLVFLSIFFVLTRSALPRYRYDQLMYIGWKAFLPVTIGYIFLVMGVCFYFDMLPDTQGNPFLDFYKP